MNRALTAALLLVPLAAGAAFSDFDQPKWALLSLLALGYGAWGFFRRSPAADAPRLLRPLIIAFAVLVLCALFVPSGEMAASWFSFREISHLALALVAFGIAAEAGRSQHRELIFAGAAVPPLLLLAHFLLSSGFNPLEIPHRRGLFTSTIGNSGLVSECLVAHLGFALLALGQGRLGRLLGLLAVAGIVAGVLVADARAGWIALAAAALTFALFFPKAPSAGPKRLPILPLVLASVTALGLLLVTLQASGVEIPRLGDRLRSAVSTDHPTNRVRLELWADALDMWRDHPLSGVGPGRFAFHHPDYRSASEWSLSGVASFVKSPHSTPLRALAETGILGALALIFALASALGLLWRKRRAEESETRMLAGGTLASLAALAVFGLLWFPLRQPATLLPLAVLFGMVAGTEGRRGPAPRSRRSFLTEGRILLLLGILAGGFTLVGIEADASAVTARDELEATKRRLRRAARGPLEGAALTELIREVSEAGLGAERCLRTARRETLGPEMRYRLLLGAADIIEEKSRLEAAAAGLENPRELRGATRTFPDDRELLEALQHAHDRAPRHLLLDRLLARTELRLGRKAEVVQRLRTRIQINPETPLLRADLAALYRADAADARDSGGARAAQSLFDRARALLREELALYPRGPEADAHWETLVRLTGRQGELLAAKKVVEDWIEARGDSELRRSLAGELALRFGETGETLGRFEKARRFGESGREADESMRQAVAALDGLEPALAHRKLLALLGRSPDQVEVLAALESVLADLVAASANPDVIRSHQRDRKRAIARAKVLYAADQLETGELKFARRNLRLARRSWPAQGDAWVLGILDHLRRNDEQRALNLIQEWRQTGFDDPLALEAFPELIPLLSSPELASWTSESAPK
jgi:O-antigen ligase